MEDPRREQDGGEQGTIASCERKLFKQFKQGVAVDSLGESALPLLCAKSVITVFKKSFGLIQEATA